MKQLSIILILSFLLGFQYAEKNSTNQFGLEIFKLLQQQNYQQIEKYCINNDEFKELINVLPNSAPINIDLEGFLSNREQLNKTFINQFQIEMQKVNIDSCKLDSIHYNYILPQRGNDEKIKWPESKKYIIDNKKITFCQLIYFIKYNNEKYILTLEVINTNNGWRFFTIGNKPKLEKRSIQ